jgi:hypothetical protein
LSVILTPKITQVEQPTNISADANSTEAEAEVDVPAAREGDLSDRS